MNTKEGFKRLTVQVPKEQYNLIMQRWLLNGVPPSQSILEALGQGRGGADK